MAGITIGISQNTQNPMGRGRSIPITAILPPAIRPVRDGQTLTDTLDAIVTQNSNYASMEGVISTVTAEWSVDGGIWTALGTTRVNYEQRIQARITVTDDQGNKRVFLTEETVVSGIAPTLEASSSLAGRDLVISVASLSGVPAPSAALATLTLDGVDVLGDATGTGPWTYTVPDSASSQTVAWVVSVTNSEGSETATDSEVVPANLTAPVALSAPSISLAMPIPGATVTITEGTYSGTPAPTIVGTLTLGGVDVTGDMVGLSYTIPSGTTGGVALVWSETASNGVSPSVTQQAGATVNVAAPGLPTAIVIVGASIVEQSFGRNLNTPNASATSALQAAGYNIPIYGYGISALRLASHNTGDPNFSRGWADALEDVRAVHPNAWIVVHLGGGDVTAYRPYGTATTTELNNFQADFDAMLASINADGGTFFVGSQTFRDYGDVTFYDPDTGSRPFNENIVIPTLATDHPFSLTSYGRPKFDFYRWMLQDFENRLETDNVHPNPTGEADMRAYVVATLATILGGSEPAEIPERVAALSVLNETETGTVTIETNIDGAIDIIISGASVTAYNGTYTITVADLDAGPVNLVPPSITGSPVDGQTLSQSYPGLWVHTGSGFSVSRTWNADGVPIAGNPSGTSHTLTPDDVGATITLVETATDSNGPRTQTSNGLGPIVAADSESVIAAGSWNITAGDGSAIINSLPTIPAAPTIASVGDGSVTLG